MAACVYKEQQQQHTQSQGDSAPAAGSSAFGDVVVVEWQDRQYEIDATGIQKVFYHLIACQVLWTAAAQSFLASVVCFNSITLLAACKSSWVPPALLS
jgi:hypothetical protein